MYRWIFFVAVIQIWINNSEAANVLRANQRDSGSEAQGRKVAESVDKWAYKPDNRGKYVHVHIPYDGGYGPFQNPYDHIDNPYAHLEGKYGDDPFKNNYFDDPKPAVYREYGAPLFNA